MRKSIAPMYDSAKAGSGNPLPVLIGRDEFPVGDSLAGCPPGLWCQRRGAGATSLYAKNRSLISAGFDNHGFNSWRGKFVTVGLGQRLECKFAGAIETPRRKNRC